VVLLVLARLGSTLRTAPAAGRDGAHDRLIVARADGIVQRPPSLLAGRGPGRRRHLRQSTVTAWGLPPCSSCAYPSRRAVMLVTEGCPSGQRDLAVNQTAMPSQVQILLPPRPDGRPRTTRGPTVVASAHRARFDACHGPGYAARSPALVAQSAEHIHGKDGVRGSIPRQGSTARTGRRIATTRDRPDATRRARTTGRARSAVERELHTRRTQDVSDHPVDRPRRPTPGRATTPGGVAQG
jgi:hypothetical protein